MHGDGHVGGNVRHRRVDHVGVDAPAASSGSSPRSRTCCDQLRIAQIGEVDLVELQIAAAGVGEGAHRLAVGLAEIAVELVHVGIDRRPARRRGRRGNAPPTATGSSSSASAVVCAVRNLKCSIIGWPAKSPSLPRHADQHLLRLHAALERDLALAGIGLDAGQRRREIGLPGGAAVLAVGDRT